jgi:hypothetical protein
MAKIKNKVDRILPYFKIMNGKIVYNGRTRSITKGYSNMAFWINGKIINCNINTVLIQYYKLKPPDTYHLYDLVRKNDTNLIVENLTWKMRLLHDYKYTPKVFYKGNRIVSKICGDCGKNLSISKFNVMIEKYTKNCTLRNKCESCRYRKQYDELKRDSVKHAKYRIHTTNFAKSDYGKAYHKKYSKLWENFERANLTDRYIKSRIIDRSELSAKDPIPHELIDIKRKQLLLKRQIA